MCKLRAINCFAFSYTIVLCGCETWSVTPREQRPGAFENTALRRIFKHQRMEVAGIWRNLHIEGFIIFTKYD
jgi:hypothetical protein